MITTDSWFMFNGKYSYEYNILVEQMPDIVIPERHVEAVEIAGRSGSLHIDYGTYKSYLRTAECALMRDTDIGKIATWLTGGGEAVFSNEPNRVYKGFINNKIPFTKVFAHFKRFPIIFDCQPFKYSLHPYRDELVFTKSTNFIGNGSIVSRPVIDIFGKGDIALNLNGSVRLTQVDGQITLNSEIESAYNGSSNQNSKMTGSFPVLTPYENRLSWVGNVQKVKIKPNWAWL